jgi:DNA-binding GntR family transcriptional regulator
MSSRLSDPPAPPSSALLHRTIASQIADALAVGIIQERYGPGDRLNEVQIAAQWGVSRSPVREALRILEARGLVTIAPQRGARITALSLQEVEQLFEIRAVLVGLAARRAASNMNAEAARRLDVLLVKLENALGSAERYEQASAATTIEIARMGGSSPLAEMIVSFAHRIGRYARLGLASRARRARSISNWRELVEAMQAGQAERAEALNRRLALENRDEAMRVLRQRSAAAAT